MKVYRSNRGSCIHFDPECVARGRTNRATTELQEFELSEVTPRRFCTTCAPPQLRDMPKTARITCQICRHTKPLPCPHNGAVLVEIHKRFTARGHNTPYTERRWAWPEFAFGRQVVGVEPPAGSGLRSRSSTST